MVSPLKTILACFVLLLGQFVAISAPASAAMPGSDQMMMEQTEEAHSDCMSDMTVDHEMPGQQNCAENCGSCLLHCSLQLGVLAVDNSRFVTGVRMAPLLETASFIEAGTLHNPPPPKG